MRADDGREIEAAKFDRGDSGFLCDCHGLTFVDGQYWINDDQVDSLLKGDGYKKTDTPEPGDVGVYRNERGEVVHSVTVTGVDPGTGDVNEVSGLGGLEPAAHSDAPTPGPGGGWPDPKATIEYYKRPAGARTDEQRQRDVRRSKGFVKDDPTTHEAP